MHIPVPPEKVFAVLFSHNFSDATRWSALLLGAAISLALVLLYVPLVKRDTPSA
jgi:uncharacterized membrane protein YagU involved in acid resistance